MLKEVIAIVRPGKWPETLKKLEEIGIPGFTRQRIYGRGKQKGLKYGLEGESGITFLPKWMVTILVEDSKVDRVLEALLASNRSGEIGDGKIFVCPLGQVIRVRTNETEELAIQ